MLTPERLQGRDSQGGTVRIAEQTAFLRNLIVSRAQSGNRFVQVFAVLYLDCNKGLGAVQMLAFEEGIEGRAIPEVNTPEF